MLNTDIMHERIYHVFDIASAAFSSDPHIVLTIWKTPVFTFASKFLQDKIIRW